MRIALFSILVLLTLFAPLWLVFLSAVVYACMRPVAYELLVLGVCIDAGFGSGFAHYGVMYTAMFGAIVLAAELIKPHLRFYEA